MATSNTLGTVASTMGFPIVLTLTILWKELRGKKAQMTSILLQDREFKSIFQMES